MLHKFSLPIEIVEYTGSNERTEYVVGWVSEKKNANYISVFPRWRDYQRDEKMIPKEAVISRHLLVEGT